MTHDAKLFLGGMVQPGESMLAPGRFQPTFLGRMSAGSQMSTNSAAFKKSLCCTLIEDPDNQTIINQEFFNFFNFYGIQFQARGAELS